MLCDEAGHPVRCFGGGQVSDAVEYHEVPVFYVGGDAPQRFRRRGAVGAAGNGQDRSDDLGQPIGYIEGCQRFADLRIGFRIGVTQGVQQRRRGPRLPVDEARREPALGLRRCSMVSTPPPRTRGGACAPAVRGADDGAGAQKGCRTDPLRRVQQQLQTDAATYRITGIVECLGVKVVGDDQHRCREVGDGERLGPGRRGRDRAGPIRLCGGDASSRWATAVHRVAVDVPSEGPSRSSGPSSGPPRWMAVRRGMLMACP